MWKLVWKLVTIKRWLQRRWRSLAPARGPRSQVQTPAPLPPAPSAPSAPPAAADPSSQRRVPPSPVAARLGGGWSIEFVTFDGVSTCGCQVKVNCRALVAPNRSQAWPIARLLTNGERQTVAAMLAAAN